MSKERATSLQETRTGAQLLKPLHSRPVLSTPSKPPTPNHNTFSPIPPEKARSLTLSGRGMGRGREPSPGCWTWREFEIQGSGIRSVYRSWGRSLPQPQGMGIELTLGGLEARRPSSTRATRASGVGGSVLFGGLRLKSAGCGLARTIWTNALTTTRNLQLSRGGMRRPAHAAERNGPDVEGSL